MRTGHRSQLADVTRGVSGRPLRVTSGSTSVYIWATLRHFDSKVMGWVKIGPIIPCERRLANTEFSESQEVTFGARFGYRDYGRPFSYFSVTLCCFD